MIKRGVTGVCRQFLAQRNYIQNVRYNKWQAIHARHYADYVQINLPALSPTMEEGSIVRWLVKEGDEIEAGDVLYEMETDKATMEVESSEDGKLAKIIVPSGVRKVNDVVALFVDSGTDLSNFEMPDLASLSGGASAPEATDAEPPAAQKSAEAATPPSLSTKTNVFLLPATRAILESYHALPEGIPSSGPKGHLLKGDVIRYIESGGTLKAADSASDSAPAPAPAPTSSTTTSPPTIQASTTSANKYVDIELTNIRKVIASRLSESKATIPHSYTTMDIEMDNVIKFRKQLKENGVAVSVNDFIIKACACALRDVPAVNSQLGKDSSVSVLDSVDISIAVATPSGLITPIIPAADGKSLQNISTTIKELAGRARENKLKPHEYQGGSFSISNLGMFGVSEFTAVINPPQSAIMAVGTNRQVVSSVTEDDDLGIKNLMSVTVSYDQRVIERDEMAEWLDKFKQFMEQPMKML